MIEQKHLDLLLDLKTDENPHSGRDLLDHLRGTHDYLLTWGNCQAVCLGAKTDENPHSGRDLLDHLRGTHDYLFGETAKLSAWVGCFTVSTERSRTKPPRLHLKIANAFERPSGNAQNVWLSSSA